MTYLPLPHCLLAAWFVVRRSSLVGASSLSPHAFKPPRPSVRKPTFLWYGRSVDPDILWALFRALAEENVEYALVGGLALDVHGIGRLTGDIDLFVRPTDVNVGRLQSALRRVWQDDSIEEIRAEDLSGDYPAIRYVAPDGTAIDVLARLGEAFRFDDLETVVESYGTVRVRVATPATLYRMKRDTVRLRDKVDAEMLKNKFGLKD